MDDIQEWLRDLHINQFVESEPSLTTCSSSTHHHHHNCHHNHHHHCHCHVDNSTTRNVNTTTTSHSIECDVVDRWNNKLSKRFRPLICQLEDERNELHKQLQRNHDKLSAQKVTISRIKRNLRHVDAGLGDLNHQIKSIESLRHRLAGDIEQERREIDQINADIELLPQRATLVAIRERERLRTMLDEELGHRTQ